MVALVATGGTLKGVARALADGRRGWRPTLAVAAATVTILLSLAWSLGDDATSGALRAPAPAFRRLLVDDFRALPLLLLSGFVGVLVAAGCRRRALSLAWLADSPRATAVAVSVACAALSWLAYQRHPLAMDESSQLFQARVFAAGKLSASFEPGALRWLFFPPFLGGFFTASPEGHVTSVYGPGFALALAPFEALGLGFLLNPVLAGGTTWLLGSVGSKLFEGDRQRTGMAMALLIASPAFLINGASFYSMNAHLFANLAFVRLLLEPSSKRALAAGAVGAWAFSLHNPFPHLLFAWPWWLTLPGPGRFRRLASLAAGYVLVGSLLVVGWSIFRAGLRPPNPSGGGPFPFVAPSLEVLGFRLQGLGKLVAWAPFGLLPLAILGAFKGGGRSHTLALVASAVSTLAGYLVVTFDQGHGWGYRYFHSAYATLPLLAALGLGQTRAGEPAAPALTNAVAGWSIAALLLLVPYRALQVHDFIAQHLRQRADTSASTGQCVHFINPKGYDTGDLIQNAPSLVGRDLYLTDHGLEENQRLLSRYLPDAKRQATTHSDTAYCGRSLAALKAAFTRGPLSLGPAGGG